MNNTYWNGIRSFIAVAEHGSFTAAADALDMSKASLSQQASTLEQQLGVQLLHRTTRKLRLTEIGQGYYHRCKVAMSQLTGAQEWACQSMAAMSGTIRLNSVGGLIGEEVVAPLLIEYQQNYPEIQTRLDFSSQKEDLLSEQFDLVLRMGSLADSTLIARKLYTTKTRYVCSPKFLKNYGKIDHPKDLKGAPLIYGSVSEWQLVNKKQRYSIRAEEGFQISNGRVMYQAVAAGLGVARLVDIYVEAGLENGTLIEVLPGWSQQTPISLLCPPGRYQLKRVKHLMEWLAERFEPCYVKRMHQGL